MTRLSDVFMLVCTWVLIQIPMFLVTMFLFAFDQGTSRMVPVVERGWWIVGLVVLLVGLIALARTRSFWRAQRLMLAGAALAWAVAIVAYRLVSPHLVTGPPPPGRP